MLHAFLLSDLRDAILSLSMITFEPLAPYIFSRQMCVNGQLFTELQSHIYIYTPVKSTARRLKKY